MVTLTILVEKSQVDHGVGMHRVQPDTLFVGLNGLFIRFVCLGAMKIEKKPEAEVGFLMIVVPSNGLAIALDRGVVV